MITKRIIPCLDIRGGRVVKGRNFEGVRDVDSPVALAQYYNTQGADELVFYDITASAEGRGLFTDVLTGVAREVFIPLTVGGNINSVDDFERVLGCGADKVSVNTGAVRTPSLIEAAARKYGNQCVVLSMDIKRVDGQFRVFAKGGREDTGIDALEWARRGAESGAGELVVNSIDTDGVRDGFDLEMLAAICERVRVPVIASGGAGRMEHFKALFQTLPGVDAGLAASIFHYKEVGIPALKKYLRAQGIEMRIGGEPYGPEI
ncbi:MAG: imidazole glycerol phosphate synthase subunit HisF [Firmicutes bacterium]|nr:imidazole glycerol phosphate synthase subunit HisF [Bacillota bacterium]